MCKIILKFSSEKKKKNQKSVTILIYRDLGNAKFYLAN